jgi:hypothetical protein
MRTIGLLADKLFSGVVPQIKAAACCGGAGMTFTESCGLPAQWRRAAEDVRDHLPLRDKLRRLHGYL